MTKSTREDKLEACSTSFDEDIRFFFQDLPRIFRAKHEAAMKELEKAIAEMKPKIRKERLAHEKAHRETFGQFLSELEEHLKAWVNGTGPQDSRRFGALARETCRQLAEANQEALQKDSDFRRLEEWLDGALESIAKQFAKKETAFADDVYRQVALQLSEKYSKNLAFRQKPYEVELRDDEIVAPPVSLAREDGAWIGDNWIGPQPTATQEMFPPPEDALFPVGIVHPYQTPGWLTYGAKSVSAKKASAVLSNVLFQRLLSGLPNIKVAIFDSGRSDIKDYEHDLCENLPPDLEIEDNLLVKISDFQDFTSHMKNWLEKQPENYKKSRQNKAGNKRLFQLFAVLVLPDNPTESESETYHDWITWWIRQAPRGVGLFVVSTDNVYKTVGRENDGFAHLMLDNSGQNLALGEGGELWAVKKTTVNPSWATKDEDLNMGRLVLQKLIRPPEKELPGVVNVRFAYEKNGESFCLRYSSSQANTVFIYGPQGSGKSVALLFFILRAAKKYSPEELTFYVFDFKNTFSLLRNLKHVECLTLSTNEQIMLGVLQDIEAHRQERQERFRQVKDKYRKPCNDLDDYNRFRTEHPEDGLLPLPRILVVVDECKNMLLAKQREIGELLEKELLSKNRAAGIHFLFATTEDIREEMGRRKFAATLELLDPRNTHGRFIANLLENESKRTLTLPVIPRDEIDNELHTIDEINRKHEREGSTLQPLFFDEDKDAGVAVLDYAPFAEEIRKLADSMAGEDGFRCATGIDSRHLRQLHSVQFRCGRSGQGLSIFGHWNSPCFRGGMELFLRTLEMVARRGKIRVDVLDIERRWDVHVDTCGGRFNVWQDSGKFLEVKREWIKAADGQGDCPRVLVAFDAEDTLQGEKDRAGRNRGGMTTHLDGPPTPVSSGSRGPTPEELLGKVAHALTGTQEGTDLSTALPPDEVDQLFQNEAFLKAASVQNAFLVAVTERPKTFQNSLVPPDSFGRFLVYSMNQPFSDLDSAPKGMGYYTDSPGEDSQYFLPFAGDDIAKAVLKAVKQQKGTDKT